MSVTGFGNLAIKVADLDEAESFYRSTGARIGERGPWAGGERLDVELPGLPITLFTRAIYEDDVDLPPECFLHVAVFTDDLDAALIGRDLVWGPEVVEGVFGRRRIAFVDAPGGTRLEFMEQLDGAGERSPVKVTRILHHSVNVEGGLDEAVDFYRRFSVPDADRPTIPGVAGHWFTVADAQVHLVDAPAGPSGIQPTGPHVCFGVEDLDAAVAELDEAGISYVRGLQGSVVQIWVIDPAGNTIELQQDPAAGS